MMYYSACNRAGAALLPPLFQHRVSGTAAMWLVASTTSSLVFLAGVLLLIVILLRRAYRYQRRRRAESRDDRFDSRGDTALVRQPITHLAEAPPGVLRWQVAMHEAVRDLRAEADSKMRALQALVRCAEEASARLEAAIVNAQRSGAAEDDDLELVRQLGDEVASQASSSRTWASGVQLPAVLPHEMGQVPLWQQRQVLDLAHQGTSAAQIAETIAISLGDVELILSMSDHPS
jgi:hypothetical protein